MIATLPAVQHSCRASELNTTYSPERKRSDKRLANRRHRRHLNARTRTFIHDPELFESEGFDAPSLSSWDID